MQSSFLEGSQRIEYVLLLQSSVWSVLTLYITLHPADDTALNTHQFASSALSTFISPELWQQDGVVGTPNSRHKHRLITYLQHMQV